MEASHCLLLVFIFVSQRRISCIFTLITSSVLFLLLKFICYICINSKTMGKYKLRLSKHQGIQSSVTEYFVEHNAEEWTTKLQSGPNARTAQTKKTFGL